jgi:hypothetical protein
MPLVGKGRLSVQPVSDAAFATVIRMGHQGGWIAKAVKGPWVAAGSDSVDPSAAVNKEEEKKKDGVEEEEEEETRIKEKPPAKAGKKRTAAAAATAAAAEGGAAEAQATPAAADEGLRRSKRGRG